MKSRTLTLSKFALFLAVGALGFTSCGDDDDGGAAPDNRNKTQLLTDAAWKTTGLMYDSTGTTSDENIFADFDNCDKDDLHKFNATSAAVINGTYTWTEGATKCDPTDPDQVATGNWMFTNAEMTKISMPEPFSGSMVEWNIVELTASSMKLRHVISSSENLDWNFSH